MSKQVGIRDVAQAAGVSRTTASDALNGSGRVDPRTRLRVAAAAQRLGYQANAHARMLRRGRSGILAVASGMTADSSIDLTGVEYFVDVLASSATTAISHGYAIVLLPLGSDHPGGLIADGGLVLDPVAGDPRLRQFSEAGLPTVTTGRPPEVPPDACTWVDNDIAGACREGLDLLAQRGARRIALVTTDAPRSYGIDTIETYRAWTAARGVPPRIASVGNLASETTGYAAALPLFKGPDRPDAIYATLDRLAAGTLLAARARGLSVPDDLMITAGSDSEGTRSADPPITALQLHPKRIGQRAAELLIERIEGNPPFRQLVVPAEWVERASTRRRPDKRQAGQTQLDAPPA